MKATCERCGGITDTKVAENAFGAGNPMILRCYARLDEGTWIPGCAYHEQDADPVLLERAGFLIQQHPWEKI